MAERGGRPGRRGFQSARWAGGGVGEGSQGTSGHTPTSAAHPGDVELSAVEPTSRKSQALGTEGRVERRRWAGRARAGRDSREWRGWPRADGSRRGSASTRRSRDTRGRPLRTPGVADRPRGSGAEGGGSRRLLMAPPICGREDEPCHPLLRRGRPGQSRRWERPGSTRAAWSCRGAVQPGRPDRASRRRGRARRDSGPGARGGPG